MIGKKRVRPVYRNDAPKPPGEQKLPFIFGGRGRDVAYDLEDVDTGEIERRPTEREELRAKGWDV